jgi:hypothetical protein
MNPGTYHALADLVLIVHVLYVAFVVFGLVLIWWGGFRGWNWVRNPWFRAAHLAAIGGVVAQSWLGMECPMTTLENSLRDRAGDPAYAGGFIAHWLHALLYYDAPSWVFTLGYSLFGLAVMLSLVVVRPRSFCASGKNYA